MTKNFTVQLVYMTPSLAGLDNVDAADEFENLGDLTRRAGLHSLEATLDKAVIYYQYFLDARESGRVMLAQPYNSPNSFILDDDDEKCDYHVADRLDVQLSSDILDNTVRRAGLESVDELLKRSLILFEQVVLAREAGWGVALYDRKTGGHHQWIVDPDFAIAPSHHGPGAPTLQ